MDVGYYQWSLFMDDGKLKTMSVVSLAEMSDATFCETIVCCFSVNL